MTPEASVIAIAIVIGLFCKLTSIITKGNQEELNKKRQSCQATATNPVKEARNNLQIAKLEKQIAAAEAQNLAYQDKIKKLSPNWAKAAKNKATIDAYKTRIEANNLLIEKIIDLQVAKQEYDG